MLGFCNKVSAWTDGPTDGPTDWPSEWPTDGPTDSPTEAPTEAPNTCPDGWINANYLGCFYFDNSKPDRHLSWVEAMDTCDSLGGYLAEIETEEQAEFIVNLQKSLYQKYMFSFRQVLHW